MNPYSNVPFRLPFRVLETAGGGGGSSIPDS